MFFDLVLLEAVQNLFISLLLWNEHCNTHFTWPCGPPLSVPVVGGFKLWIVIEPLVNMILSTCTAPNGPYFFGDWSLISFLNGKTFIWAMHNSGIINLLLGLLLWHELCNTHFTWSCCPPLSIPLVVGFELWVLFKPFVNMILSTCTAPNRSYFFGYYTLWLLCLFLVALMVIIPHLFNK